MICISISEPSLDKILEFIGKAEMAEIRLDLMDLSDLEIEKIFSQPVKLIATCRQGKFNDEERKKKLIKAIQSGASYVDIEIESNDDFKKEIKKIAKSHKCKLIISFHDFDKTPSTEELNKIVDDCFSEGADIAKIACKANTENDAVRILSLYVHHKNLVALGMGEKGMITRVASLLLGAPFSFASIGTGKETASGQIEFEDMKKIMNKLQNTDTKTKH